MPFLFQSGDRARRQRRVFAQKPAQRQIEVALCQAVKVQLRQQLSHFGCLTQKQGKNTALEATLQTTHSRSPDRDRPAAQSEMPRFAVAVPVSLGRIHTLRALRLAAAQQLRHLFLEKVLKPRLNPAPKHHFEVLPCCS